MAKLCKINIDYIYLYPLGGISKFQMPLNISSQKEFLILIFGPLFQIVGSKILIFLFPYDYELIMAYHQGILIFNLLPIYPLDGGKLVNLFLNEITPYKQSLKIVTILSYGIILLIIVKSKKININLIVMVLMLLFLINKERKKINEKYNKFLLERYLNNYSFAKSKVINNKDKFYRNTRHIIYENNHYYLEKEYLIKKFQEFNKNR